jgi:CRISPR-associated protein Cas2
MKPEEARFMWLFVLFDLPVGSKDERRHANRFRNFLKDDGYLMLQFSVYARICRAEEAVDKHIARVIKSLPPKGSVRALQVTDKQFGRMKLLVGDSSKNEKAASQQLVLL